ncbi:MAG: hypothetical protein GY793_06895 [Proteobacteria bacterium]|nr:hypothetical protein [Pseudomonadota bacterium]
MGHKSNRRILTQNEYQAEPSMKLKDLRKVLEKEKREEHSKIIKEIIFNRFFARIVFAVCILLNLVFITLGVLDYFKLIG